MNKCIYITGGSSGIGLALARYYTKAGDDIVLLARDQAKLDEAADSCRELSASPKQKIVCESLDVTAYEHLPKCMDGVITLGPPRGYTIWVRYKRVPAR